MPVHHRPSQGPTAHLLPHRKGLSRKAGFRRGSRCRPVQIERWARGAALCRRTGDDRRHSHTWPTKAAAQRERPRSPPPPRPPPAWRRAAVGMRKLCPVQVSARLTLWHLTREAKRSRHPATAPAAEPGQLIHPPHVRPCRCQEKQAPPVESLGGPLLCPPVDPRALLAGPTCREAQGPPLCQLHPPALPQLPLCPAPHTGVSAWNDLIRSRHGV